MPSRNRALGDGGEEDERRAQHLRLVGVHSYNTKATLPTHGTVSFALGIFTSAPEVSVQRCLLLDRTFAVLLRITAHIVSCEPLCGCTTDDSPGPDLQKKAHKRSVSYGENYSEGYPITHKNGFL